MSKQQIRIPATPSRVGIIERIAKMLHALPTELPWTVTVEQYKPKRSNSQNALLWGWVYPQILAVARDKLPDATDDELHEFFLIQHYGPVRKTYFGMPKMAPKRRSSELNKQEFSEHIEFILAYMANAGYLVEMPEDYREVQAA
jgi:hypothetical protein